MIADKLTRIQGRIVSVNEKTAALNERLRALAAQFAGIDECFSWYDDAISIALIDGDIRVGHGGEVPETYLLSASRQLRLRFVENLDRFTDALEKHIDAELALFDRK